LNSTTPSGRGLQEPERIRLRDDNAGIAFDRLAQRNRAKSSTDYEDEVDKGSECSGQQQKLKLGGIATGAGETLRSCPCTDAAERDGSEAKQS